MKISFKSFFQNPAIRLVLGVCAIGFLLTSIRFGRFYLRTTSGVLDFSGKIISVEPNVLRIQNRSGKVATVYLDDSTTYQLDEGQSSENLTVGLFILVSGKVEVPGEIHATYIQSLAPPREPFP
ncbi:MAG: hypothetical protein ABI425_00025 [Patescibacteria group bacterium]